METNVESGERKNREAFKSGVWYTISNVIIRSVSILTAPIFTRILTTSDYGKASNFTAWMSLFAIFTGLCLSYSFGRANIDFKEQFNEYVLSMQTLSSGFALLIFIFAVLLSKQLAILMNMEQFLVIILFLYLLIVPSVDYMQTKYRFCFKYKENITITYINTIGVVGFSLIFIFIFNEQRYLGRIIGIILPMFLIGIVFYVKIFIEGKRINLTYWSYALKISIPMIPHALAIVVLTQIDRIMITKFSGSSALGIYSFGYSYAILLSIFTNSIAQAWIPWLYNEYHSGRYELIKKANKIINIGMGMLTILFVSIAPEVLKLLGTEAFWEAKWVVAPIAIGAFFQYLYSNYSSIELYHKKTIPIAVGTILAAGINYILNYMFIPKYGYVAAAYTTCISYLFLVLFHWINCKKIIKEKIYDDAFILKIIVVTVIITIGVVKLYDAILIRYLFLVVCIVMMSFIYKSEVKTAVIKLKQQFSSKK
ncbi:lipopolysaccharide biosynthesis protein [Fusibacter sp. 3D3]|uniref:lipopolysaccharide biosynthesis protein n=1 Tax=Fusibacter sp. 3D3 TaxID=1048380 RepID=UPI00085359C8|nr:oligosaccharide flippase family protein [Fusibacter sp. 3D3]GAU77780.1 repeat unit transporter [Fusibacter sp. 3D3]